MLFRIVAFSLISILAAPGCHLYFESDQSDGNASPPSTPQPQPQPPSQPQPQPQPQPPQLPVECILLSLDNSESGFPFDVERFLYETYPILQENCDFAGCHNSNNGFPFEVWNSTDSVCPENQTFNSFFRHADLGVPPHESSMITNLNETNPTHPVQYSSDDYRLQLISLFIEDAYYRLNPGIGLDPIELLDYSYYNDNVQPMLDSAGCSLDGCHSAYDDWSTGLELYPYPVTYSNDMLVNFITVAQYIDVIEPEASLFYIRSIDSHRGLTVTFPDVILEWIYSATGN